MVTLAPRTKAPPSSSAGLPLDKLSQGNKADGCTPVSNRYCTHSLARSSPLYFHPPAAPEPSSAPSSHLPFHVAHPTFFLFFNCHGGATFARETKRHWDTNRKHLPMGRGCIEIPSLSFLQPVMIWDTHTHPIFQAAVTGIPIIVLAPLLTRLQGWPWHILPSNRPCKSCFLPSC